MQPSDQRPASPAHEPALNVEHVYKEYARRSLLPWKRRRAVPPTVALRDVSLRVETGETIGLLGPNGAGKTTLLKTIATLIYPTSGSVRIHGHDVLEDQVRTRGLIGLVTCDERSFYWRLTGRQNLAFFAALYGLSKSQFRARAEDLLETLGLAQAADRLYHTYSAGMKQKLAIARGLLADPRLVLYDEPTRSLDPLSQQNIRGWIVRKRRESGSQTHVIATNQLDEAEQLCDRVVIINRGVIIAAGTIDEIRERWHQREYEIHRVSFRGPPVDGLLRPDPDSGLLEVAEEPQAAGARALRLRVRKGSAALSRVLESILRQSGTIVRCDMEEPPFDEVFCSLVLGDAPSSAAAGPPATPPAAEVRA
ncbi:MAG: ABC transporter ATP-binding protein [Planctomycetes bacterium]|nr:ABC transporter ATP-binding protein [Planctomycetota bacterium]